jgi:inhibitor of KinA sporulation pathway (predicted exonuclease)
MSTLKHENFCSLDLEFNQPSEKIFQIGACVGSIRTGEILSTFNQYVSIGENLSPYIVNLCGVSNQRVLAEGVKLGVAYESLVAWLAPYNVFRNPITWGGGDSISLRHQLVQLGERLDDESFIFGRRWIDCKTVFSTFTLAIGGVIRVGGLAKSMTRVKLNFMGKRHDALDDAINTWRMYHKLVELIRK